MVMAVMMVVMVGGVAVVVGCSLMDVIAIFGLFGDVASHVMGTCCPNLCNQSWTSSSVVKCVLIVTAKGQEFKSVKNI